MCGASLFSHLLAQRDGSLKRVRGSLSRALRESGAPLVVALLGYGFSPCMQRESGDRESWRRWAGRRCWRRGQWPRWHPTRRQHRHRNRSRHRQELLTRHRTHERGDVRVCLRGDERRQPRRWTHNATGTDSNRASFELAVTCHFVSQQVRVGAQTRAIPQYDEIIIWATHKGRSLSGTYSPTRGCANRGAHP